MAGRNSQQGSQRPVAKLPGASFVGLSAFCLWMVLGAAFSFAFASCGGLVGSIIFLLILIWALLGPFALSFCFVELAGILMQRGLYRLAERVARVGVYVDRSVLPLVNLVGMVDSPLAVLNLLNLSNAQTFQCRFKEAKETLDTALDKAQGALGWDHYLTQTVVGQLAAAYISLGKFDEAEQNFRRAIASKSNQLRQAPENAQAQDLETLTVITGLAVDRFGLANLMEKQQRFEQAEEQYRQAIDTVEKHVSEDTDYLANHLNALADLYLKTDRLHEAEELARRAYAIRKEIFAGNHIVISSSYHTLGVINRLKGNLVDASRHLYDALRIRQKFLGENHPNVAETYIACAELELQKGDLPRAESHLKKALDSLQTAYNEDFPDVAIVLDAYAKYYERTGDNTRSAEAREQAEKIRRMHKRP